MKLRLKMCSLIKTLNFAMRRIASVTALVVFSGFFADSVNAVVIRVDPVTGAQSIVSSGNNLVNPQGIAVDASGQIFVADPNLGSILPAFTGPGGVLRIDPVTGAQTVVSTGGSFNGPTGIAIEADGSLVTTQVNSVSNSTVVIRVDPLTGTQTPVFQPAGGFNGFDIAVGADGSLVVANWSTPAVFRINPVTGVQTTITTGGSLFQPKNLAIEADGDILVATGILGAVTRIDPVSGVQTVVTPGSSGTAGSDGIAVESSGDILLAGYRPTGGSSILGIFRVDPITGAEAVVSSGGLFSSFGLRPKGIALEADGSILVTAFGGLDPAPFPAPVPLPAAVWLFGSGLLGLIGIAKKRKGA